MALRFPSLDVIANGAKRAVSRFPLAAPFFVATAVVGHLWIADDKYDQHIFSWSRWIVFLLGTGFLGFAVRLRFETRDVHSRMQGVVAPFLIGLPFLLHQVAPPFTQPQGLAFLAQWTVLVLVFVMLAPFSRPREVRGFWRHGQAVIDRALLAGIFSFAGFGGLALAGLAVEGLFGLKMPKDFYPHLLSFFGYFVAPMMFLGSYPTNTKGLDTDSGFPGALRSFAQWVLVPLVSVYGLILLAYAAQIAFKSEWPKGMVGWLVSWAGVLGLATNLILLPLADKHDLRWIRVFLRAFYGALIVFSVLLGLALYRRVSEYGWTEERVLLGLLALWFFGLAALFTARPRASRQWIPASLGLLAFATWWGPVTPTKISMRDQTRRLERLVRELGIMPSAPLKQKLSNADRLRLWNQLEFFSDRRALDRVVGMLPPVNDPSVSSLMVGLGQPADFPYQGGDVERWYFGNSDRGGYPVGGFDYIVELRPHFSQENGVSRSEFEVAGKKWKTAVDGKTFKIEGVDGKTLATFDLEKWRNGLSAKYFREDEGNVQLTLPEATLDAEPGSVWKARLFLGNGQADRRDGLRVFGAWLAFRERKE